MLSSLICSALLAGLALTQGPVGVGFSPLVTCTVVNSVIDLEVELDSAGQPVQIGAVDLLLQWDPQSLQLLQSFALGGGWLAAGFFPDPDGINLNLNDGTALFSLLSNPALPVALPPALKIARFRFKVLAAGQLALLPSLGTFGKTRVLGAVPGLDLTGNLGGPTLIGIGTGPSNQTVRLGVPPNPAALLPAPGGGPRIGQPWDPRIDHQTFLPTALVDLLVVSATGTNLSLPPYGTLLCLPPEVLPAYTTSPGVPFPITVPPKCGLIGLSLCTQGLSIGPAFEVELTNALDITVGSF